MFVKEDNEMLVIKKYIINNRKKILDNSGFYEIEEFIKNVENIKKFERPDFYLKVGNTIYMLEHFEFDNSPVSKKGNYNKRERAIIYKEAERKINKGEEEVHFRKSLKSTSYKAYCKNAITNYNNHYNKISSYKEQLYKEGIADEKTIFKIGFFMEDTSSLPLIYVDECDGNFFVSIFTCKEFIEYFKKKTNVDFCFWATNFNDAPLCLLTHDIARKMNNNDFVDPVNILAPTPQYSMHVQNISKI